MLSRLAAEFGADPSLAVAQPRGADPDGLPAPRRWVPRLRTGDGGADVGGEVVVFWEGVCTIRREAFDQVEGWPGHFWYGHEGIDLAFRLVDAGWRLRYCPDVVVHHPATSPTRHAVFYRMNARNRVWVAKRNLPHPLSADLRARLGRASPCCGSATARTCAPGSAGCVEGIRTDAGPRRPMKWRTVLRLTRAGRPPVV